MEIETKNASAAATDKWRPCRPGLLTRGQASSTKKVVIRKSDLFSLGMIYLSGGLVAFAIFFSWQNSATQGRASLLASFSCEEVRRNLASYTAMEITNCRTRARISHHLCRCSDCDLIYQSMNGNYDLGASYKQNCTGAIVPASFKK